MSNKGKLTDAGKRLLAGLEEVADIVEGKAEPAAVHEVHVGDIDVGQIRAATGLTQMRFAKSIGVSTHTLRNWEQGRRKPEGPAQVLLALVEKNPKLIQEMLTEPA